MVKTETIFGLKADGTVLTMPMKVGRADAFNVISILLRTVAFETVENVSSSAPSSLLINNGAICG
jgi:hypothetical protein